MRHQLTCLLVDDDREDQEIFADAISEVAPDIRCLFASDGVEAIHLLSEGEIRPDYIFLDINMPRMNGYEFLKTVKEMPELKDIPVVVHSTSARPKEMEELMKLGAFGIHMKEYSYQCLCNMLRKYLASLKYA